jgi:hypothetical protein
MLTGPPMDVTAVPASPVTAVCVCGRTDVGKGSAAGSRAGAALGGFRIVGGCVTEPPWLGIGVPMMSANEHETIGAAAMRLAFLD